MRSQSVLNGKIPSWKAGTSTYSLTSAICME